MHISTQNSQPKWADWCITHVRPRLENGRRGRLIAFLVRPDYGPSLGEPIEMTLEEVLIAMKAGQTFCTVVWRNTKWWYGAEVEPRRDVRRGIFLTTLKDGTVVDNLDELPTF